MRDYNAEYYDIDEFVSGDIDFYLKHIPEGAQVLELGCGSGRVTIPLAEKVKELVGVDISKSMLKRAQEKTQPENIEWIYGDITDLDLNQKFDFVIAPFRVLQCLEHERDISGFFDVVKMHLKENGRAILNVFNPNRSPEKMATEWRVDGEVACGEKEMPNGDILKTFETREKIDVARQVIYPKIIYRRYRGENLIDEHINAICMKYYYPQEFKQRLQEAGFNISNAWGGYEGQGYGEGPELVVEVCSL